MQFLLYLSCPAYELFFWFRSPLTTGPLPCPSWAQIRHSPTVHEAGEKLRVSGYHLSSLLIPFFSAPWYLYLCVSILYLLSYSHFLCCWKHLQALSTRVPAWFPLDLRPAWCWNEGFRVTSTTTLTLAGEARHHSLMSTPKHVWVFVEPAPLGLAFAPQFWLPRHPQNLLFTAACMFTSSWVRTLSLYHLTCIPVSCGPSGSWFWCAKPHVWTKKKYFHKLGLWYSQPWPLLWVQTTGNQKRRKMPRNQCGN